MAWSGWREPAPGAPRGRSPHERGRGYSGGQNFGGMYGGYFAGRYGGDYYPPARVHPFAVPREDAPGAGRGRPGGMPARWGGGVAPPGGVDAFGGPRGRRRRP